MWIFLSSKLEKYLEKALFVLPICRFVQLADGREKCLTFRFTYREHNFDAVHAGRGVLLHSRFIQRKGIFVLSYCNKAY